MATKPDIIPRLLVASEFPPNASGGGPAVARQMLKDWPVEKLFWWSCRPDPDQRFNQRVARHAVARIPQKLYPHRRWCAQKSWFLENLWSPWAARHFQKMLDAVKPDVVWVIPHGWAIPPIAQALQKARIGFHVSLHDYADIQGNEVRFGAKRSHQMAALADKLFANATTRDAISQPMLDDLRARTGCNGSLARAGLEQEDFDFMSGKPGTPSDSIRIAYAGTIIAEKEFALVAQTLAQIRERLPLPVWLDFFSDQSYRSQEWFDAAWMREHGNLPAAELLRALRDCTWGFSPMELTDDNPRYNRFSFPTKFITYLAAGLPVITLGHSESSVVKMATTYPVGLCITDANRENLSARLFAALSDRNPGLKYRAAIQRCAAEMFDARRMRRVLYDCFQRCAARTATPELTADRAE
jgi:glycosyltransferase involved in cell wall biosynthesis